MVPCLVPVPAPRASKTVIDYAEVELMHAIAPISAQVAVRHERTMTALGMTLSSLTGDSLTPFV